MWDFESRNVYILIMKSQARPQNPATHTWNWMTFMMHTQLRHLFYASISSVPRSCTLSVDLFLDGQAVVLGRLSLVSPVLFRLNPILYTLNHMRLNDILMSLPWNVPYRYRLLEISLPEKSFDKTELKATSVTFRLIGRRCCQIAARQYMRAQIPRKISYIWPRGRMGGWIMAKGHCHKLMRQGDLTREGIKERSMAGRLRVIPLNVAGHVISATYTQK